MYVKMVFSMSMTKIILIELMKVIIAQLILRRENKKKISGSDYFQKKICISSFFKKKFLTGRKKRRAPPHFSNESPLIECQQSFSRKKCVSLTEYSNCSRYFHSHTLDM